MKDSPYRDLQPSLAVLDFGGALVVAIVAAVTLYVLALFSSLRKNASPAVVYGTLFCGLAIFNPNCWPFNFVVLLFPFMILTWHLIQGRGERRYDGWVLSCFVVAMVLLNIGSSSIGSEYLQHASEVWSFMAIAGVLVFLAGVRLNFSVKFFIDVLNKK